MSRRARIAVATVVVVALIVAIVLPVALLSGGSQPASTTSSSFDYAHAPGATTLAGSGVPGFSGDSGPAADAQLDNPSAIAEGPSGNLFVADTGNCRVRLVAARSETSFGHTLHAGEIVTVAGGSCSESAANPEPTALALDRQGDLFIALADGRVEELAASNNSTFGFPVAADQKVTVAGNGTHGYGGDGGPARNSELRYPTGLAVDSSGNLFIADTGNCRVRMVAAADGTSFGLSVTRGDIYTVAGTGVCGSSGDGGAATDAQVWDPGALAADSEGDVFVADQGNRTIRVLATHSASYFGVQIAADDLGTIAGEGSYGPYVSDGQSALGVIAEVNFPSALALDREGNLYIADSAMHVIRFVPATDTTLRGQKEQANDMYTLAGAMTTGSGNQQTKWVQTKVLTPQGLAISSSGQVIYSDAGANVVRVITAGG